MRAKGERRKIAFLDLGGVLIIDFYGTNSWEEMLVEIGAVGEKRAVFEEVWEEVSGRLDLDYDVDDMIPILNARGFDISSDYSLLRDGFVKRFRKNLEICVLLDGLLTEGWELAMITNMYPRMFEEIERAKILPAGYNLLPIINSSIEILKKPDPRIFELALKRAGVGAEDVIFIDNALRNVEAARSVGIWSFLYDFREKDAALKILKAIKGGEKGEKF
jgi:FMN phosphatase YigB (HAD superfamily)